MANVIYPKYKEALLDGLANIDIKDGTVKAILVDGADYSYNAAHDFLDDISGAAIVATATLASKTITNGTYDCADFTFTAVSGDQVEILIIYIDTGSAATSRLVAYYDTGVTGFPVTPNTSNINVTVNASGLFDL